MGVQPQKPSKSSEKLGILGKKEIFWGIFRLLGGFLGIFFFFFGVIWIFLF
jgi:hypothetical protein